MLKIEEIKKQIEEITEELNDWQRDFVAEYDLTSIRYLSDCITEFADANVNIYYSDIEDYYRDHIAESSEALKEFGYNLSDFADLEEAMHKGAQIAQFIEIEAELHEDNRLEELQQLYEELEAAEVSVKK